MSEIDHVFARLGGSQSNSTERRELQSIPRRGGATGSRVVEVLRLSPRGTTAGQDQAHRPVSKVRAATWDDGFPPKSAWGPSPSPAPVATVTLKPVAHVMPMWEPAVVEPESEAPPTGPSEASSGPTPPRSAPTRRGRRPSGRRVADPFDATDDGANCLRCGYIIEPARERRGLMTCVRCA